MVIFAYSYYHMEHLEEFMTMNFEMLKMQEHLGV